MSSQAQIAAVRSVLDSFKDYAAQREAAISSVARSIAAQTAFLQSQANFYNEMEKFFGDVKVAIDEYTKGVKA